MKVSEAIEGLRSELELAQRSGQGKDLRFVVGEVELELLVTVKASAKGKANAWVVQGEVQGEVTNGHKLKIKLQPIGGNGQAVKVSDRLEQAPG
jgi:hypothetical protein